MDVTHMTTALELGARALEEGEFHVDTTKPKPRKALRHAEFEAIDAAIEKLGVVNATALFRHCDLYVTCEPCVMCSAALVSLRFKQVFYGCKNERFGGAGTVLPINTEWDPNYKLPCTGGISADKAVQLFKLFYSQENHSAPKPRKRKPSTAPPPTTTQSNPKHPRDNNTKSVTTATPVVATSAISNTTTTSTTSKTPTSE
ncbi:tRNA-specific adenosine deaminase TAD2 [Pelomyxa schiedti]|nr:tRNA-specific adenosine deaminase TAD2 [Pelomyxa schiedti]